MAELMLDLNDVALFVEIVRAGSFAAAARRLGLPANTISRRVQEFERRVGQRLLQRTTRRMAPTSAGQALFAKCAQQVESLTQSTRELTEGAREPRGKVRVGAPADFFNWYSMDMVAEFLSLHPRVTLEFVLSDARADLLAEGIDIAFRTGKILEPELVARRIGVGSSSLVASPAYAKKRGLPASPSALTTHECIGARSGPAARMIWHLDGPDGESQAEVTGRFNANSVQVQLNAALAGFGIAFLPTLMTRSLLESGQLLQVLPGHGRHGVGVYFVYLSRRELPRAVKAFMDFNVAQIRERISRDSQPQSRPKAKVRGTYPRRSR
jgi:LysR family transcriptional regulator AphB